MLNTRQKLFCEEYLSNGMNATQAYLKVYKKEGNAGYAVQLMKKPEIKEYIDARRKEMFDAYNIDYMRVMEAIAGIAFGDVDSDEKISYTSKLKALELLSKNLNLQTVKTENKDVIEVQLVEDTNTDE